MKTCPICHAVAFDDAAVCYGCMYRFGEGDSADPEEGPCPARDSAQEPGDAPEPFAAPAFYIRMTPIMQDSGAMTWSCSVDVEQAATCP